MDAALFDGKTRYDAADTEKREAEDRKRCALPIICARPCADRYNFFFDVYIVRCRGWHYVFVWWYAV